MSPFGDIESLNVKDILEREMVREETDKSVHEFVKNSTAVNKGIKAIEAEMAGPVKAQQGQTVPASGTGAGSRLFRVKPKARGAYKGKYL
jgi:hypothetical protein